MSYSRSRTHGIKKARRNRRLRFLLGCNAVLLALIAALVIWAFQARDAGFRDIAPAPVPSAEASSPAAGDPAGKDAPPAESPPPIAGAPAEEPPADEGVGNSGKLRLAFVGDLLPAGSVAKVMEKNGYDYPFREAKSLLESADLAAGNLEAPITDRGTPEENKQYVFRGPKEALPALRGAGFDVLNLANNHTMDYGWIGLQDTMDALDDAGLRHVGAGIDDRDAFTPVYMEAKGYTAAFIGVSNVVPNTSWKADKGRPGVAELYNPARAVEAVKKAKQKADVVVVMVHWGVERADTPERYETVKGRQLIDAGADLVIGSHPHVLQGFEAYKGKWIAYSLGNFVFNVTDSPKTAETGVLVAECGKHGSCGLTFHPMLARNTQPARMDPQAGQALLDRLNAVSATVRLEENGKLVEKR